ncbi:FAD-linked oxidoreductase, partial [Micrococcus endophyticus]
LGALGVVVEAEIQAVPAFLLRAEERSEPLEDVVASFVERSRAADHLEFYWFPGTSVALTKENTRLPLGSGLDPVPPLRAAVMDRILANGLYEATCRLGAR